MSSQDAQRPHCGALDRSDGRPWLKVVGLALGTLGFVFAVWAAAREYAAKADTGPAQTD